MPRARPDYKDRSLDLPDERTAFTKEETARLRAICEEPKFLENIREAAWIWRAFRKAGNPSPAVMRATFADLGRRARELHALFEGLSQDIGAMLDRASEHKAGRYSSFEQLLELLPAFADEAYRVSRDVKIARGRRGNITERYATQTVESVFRRYGLPFKLADVGKTESPAAFCVRLVLGLPEGRRVEHLVAPPRSKK